MLCTFHLIIDYLFFFIFFKKKIEFMATTGGVNESLRVSPVPENGPIDPLVVL